MAKLSSDLSNPLRGRRPADKLGGKAKKGFMTDTLRPTPIKKRKSSGLTSW